jgi:two-component system response regulator FixJ
LPTDDNVVFIVDDDAAVRDSLAVLLSTAGLKVESYCSGAEFLDAWNPAQAGCLVLDIRMPGMSGLELLEELTSSRARIPVVIITGHGDVKIAVKAMKLGAVDFIEKPFNYEVIIGSVTDALRREEQDRTRDIQLSSYLERLALLTERERQIYDYLVQGDPNKVIAARLEISPRTVEIHRAHVMEKLQVRNLSQLVKMAILTEVS